MRCVLPQALVEDDGVDVSDGGATAFPQLQE
jgi:hypothetical protein